MQKTSTGYRFKKRKKSKKDIVLTVLIVIFATLTVVFAGLFVYDFFIGDLIDKSTVEGLSAEIDVVEPDVPSVEGVADGNNGETVHIGVDEVDLNKLSFLQFDFNKLHGINGDAVGWFQITGPKSVDGLPISNPLVQGADPEFYLTHDYKKDYNVNGALFGDETTNFSNIKANKNTIVYGHARSQQKFGGLKYLNEQAAWYENAYNHFIYLTTETEQTVWQIFSWYETTADADYRKAQFASDEKYVDYLNTLQSRNEIKALKQFIFSPEDNIITLSTCKGTDENKRVAVHAVLVKYNHL